MRVDDSVMRTTRHVVRVTALSATCTLAAAAAAHAAPVVSGRIAAANRDTLMELSPAGHGHAVVLKSSGVFRLPTDKGWTLQLISADGRYFGPVVLGHEGTKGWEALTGHTLHLGRIVIHHGYAAPAHSRSVVSLHTDAWIYTSRDGAPIGAGRLGYIPRYHKVRAHLIKTGRFHDDVDQGGPQGRQPALAQGGDPDQDGIPTAFDADATGSGEINSENPTASAEGASGGFFSSLSASMQDSLNDDASAVTPSEVSQSVQQNLALAFGMMSSNSDLLPGTNSVAIDCSALPWCSTATVQLGSGLTPGGPWDGSVPADAMRPGMFTVVVQPNATTSQIQPGDTFMINETGPNGTTSIPATIDTFFDTEPALASVGVDGGAAQPISYPATSTTLGTIDNPIMLGSGGDLNLRFWRPQRAGLPGETSLYMDMGHLRYSVGAGGGNCPAADYSNLSPTLTDTNEQGPPQVAIPLQDTADDAAPDPSDLLGLTVDLDQCLSAVDQPATGQEIIVSLLASAAEQADGSADNAMQMFYVCEPGCVVGDAAGPGASNGPGTPSGPGSPSPSGTPSQTGDTSQPVTGG
jgi:hypothetical protein